MLKEFFQEIEENNKDHLKDLKQVTSDDYMLYRLEDNEEGLFYAIKKFESLSISEQTRNQESGENVSAMIIFLQIWADIFQEHIKNLFSLSSDVELLMKKEGQRLVVIWNSPTPSNKWKDKIASKGKKSMSLYSDTLKEELEQVSRTDIAHFEPKEIFEQGLDVVGELNDDLKKLFVVKEKFSKQNMVTAESYTEKILEAELMCLFPQVLRFMFRFNQREVKIGADWKILIENELI